MRVHTRMAQVSVKKGCLHMCHTSPSRFLQSLLSPNLAVLFRSLRDHFPVRTVLAVLTCPQSAGHAHLRTSSEKFGYLAKSAFNTAYEPNEFDKITSVDSDTMLIDDPDLNEISDFSKNTHESTGLMVFSQGLNPLFRTFLMMILLFKWKAKEACIGKRIAGERERESDACNSCSSFGGFAESGDSESIEDARRYRDFDSAGGYDGFDGLGDTKGEDGLGFAGFRGLDGLRDRSKLEKTV